MANDIKNYLNDKYPVYEFNNNTVADGKLFRISAIDQLVNRDSYLADCIDNLDTNQLQQEINKRKEEDIKISVIVSQEEYDRSQLVDIIPAKLYLEEDKRKAADEEISKNISNEIETRLQKDEEINVKLNDEITNRKTEDEKINNKINSNNNLYLKHINEISTSSTSGHITINDYKNYIDTYNEVFNSSANWGAISAFNIKNNKITNQNVTLKDSNFVGLTVSGENTIDIHYQNKTEEDIGKNKGIYLKNGEFKPCEYELESLYGHSVIELTSDKDNSYAASITYINESETPIYEFETIQKTNYIYGTPWSRLIQKALQEGANELTIRYGAPNNILYPENIVINPEDLKLYKMYSVNIVPLFSSKEYFPNINLVFSADKEKYINYSDANYASVDYGYFYNVPKFAPYNRSDNYEGAITVDDLDAPPKKINTRIYKNYNKENDIDNTFTFNNLRYGMFLNDGMIYNNNKVTYNNLMNTIQPHNMCSILFKTKINEATGKQYTIEGRRPSSVTTVTTTSVEGIAGHSYIKGKMGYINKSTGLPEIYRRQVRFMRGEDINVEKSTNNFKLFSYDTKTSKWTINSTCTFGYNLKKWADSKQYNIIDKINNNIGNLNDTSITTVYGILNNFLNSDDIKKGTLFPYAQYYCKNYSLTKENEIVNINFINSGTGYTIYFFTEAVY